MGVFCVFSGLLCAFCGTELDEWRMKTPLLIIMLNLLSSRRQVNDLIIIIIISHKCVIMSGWWWTLPTNDNGLEREEPFNLSIRLVSGIHLDKNKKKKCPVNCILELQFDDNFLIDHQLISVTNQHVIVMIRKSRNCDKKTYKW